MGHALTFIWADGAGAAWRTEPKLQGSVAVALRYVIGVFRGNDSVGVARRRVAVSEADGLYVDHLTLEINDASAKGNGFATAYWDASLAQYESLSIDRVIILADDEGRAFWARDPVRFADPVHPRIMLANWAVPGPNIGSGPDGLRHAAARRGVSDVDIATFIAEVDEEPQAFTPAHLYASEIGRLLLSGASWRGTVHLPRPTDGSGDTHLRQ
jgi:hypothetical protein